MGEQPKQYRELQSLLDRHGAGDPTARERLIEWCDKWERSRSAARLRSFRGVERWVQADDLHNAALDLLNKALMTELPATPAEFLGLLSWQINSQPTWDPNY